MNIYFIITDRCNCSCNFCIRKNLGDEINGEVSLESFTQILQKLRTIYSSNYIVLTGGEPTRHSLFPQILQIALTYYPEVIITSNGTFDDACADLLLKNIERLHIQFSIDGTKDVHDGIRGKGVYDKALGNLRKFQNYKERIVVSSTIGEAYYSDCIELGDSLNSLSFNYWKVSPVHEWISSVDYTDYAKKWNQFVNTLLPHCNFAVHTQKLFDFNLWDRVKESGNNSPISTNCGIGSEKIYVTSKGDFYPCTCLEESVGNVLSSDKSSILSRMDEYKNMKPCAGSVCADCRYKELCNGGCPGFSKKVFGKIGMGDIRCPKVLSKAYG